MTMKDLFKPGDQKKTSFIVTDQDFATFRTGTLHKVCSTFTLGREMEWSSRLFVIDMLEEDEEGVGTFLTIDHHAPAFLGENVKVIATFKSLKKNEVICDIQVNVNQRIIATGSTGQKILSKDKINQIFTSLER